MPLGISNTDLLRASQSHQPTNSIKALKGNINSIQIYHRPASPFLSPQLSSEGRDVKLFLYQLSLCHSGNQTVASLVWMKDCTSRYFWDKVKRQDRTQSKWTQVNTISYQHHKDAYQDILTADIRPFVAVNVLLTSFSSFFNLCSTSLRSRSARRFSRSADSASIDKSFSSAHPPLSASSNVPSSLLLCGAK